MLHGCLLLSVASGVTIAGLASTGLRGVLCEPFKALDTPLLCCPQTSQPSLQASSSSYVAQEPRGLFLLFLPMFEPQNSKKHPGSGCWPLTMCLPSLVRALGGQRCHGPGLSGASFSLFCLVSCHCGWQEECDSCCFIWSGSRSPAYLTYFGIY